MSKAIYDIPVRNIEDWESGKHKPPAWAEKLIIKELERIAAEKSILMKMKYDDKKKMKNYLRFGEIPKNGKSINFFQIMNEQNDYFSDCLRMGYIDQAYEDIPEDAYEPGLSVFDMDADGLPVLGALRRMISLLARLEEPAYIITGREVGKGNDGEPLVTVEGVEPTKIEKGEIWHTQHSGFPYKRKTRILLRWLDIHGACGRIRRQYRI